MSHQHLLRHFFIRKEAMFFIVMKMSYFSLRQKIFQLKHPALPILQAVGCLVTVAQRSEQWQLKSGALDSIPRTIPAFHFQVVLILEPCVDFNDHQVNRQLQVGLSVFGSVTYIYIIAYYIQSHHCHQCSLECYHSGQRKEYTDDCCKETLNRKLRRLQKTVHTVINPVQSSMKVSSDHW